MGKRPAFLFYPSDWTRDLDEHPLEISGAWISLLCKLFWIGGRATKPLGVWAKILHVRVPKAVKILSYLQRENIATIVPVLSQDCSSKTEVTIESRRIVRDLTDRDNTRLRVRRHRARAKQTVADVTPVVTPEQASLKHPRSVSRSSSVSNNVNNVRRKQIDWGLVDYMGELLSKLCNVRNTGEHRNRAYHIHLAKHVPSHIIHRALEATQDAVIGGRNGERDIVDPDRYFSGALTHMCEAAQVSVPHASQRESASSQ